MMSHERIKQRLAALGLQEGVHYALDVSGSGLHIDYILSQDAVSRLLSGEDDK